MDECNHFGTVAESRTHTKLTELGYIVFTTREERLPYDRVISHPAKPNKFLRIQIKGSRAFDKNSGKGRYEVFTSKGKGGSKTLYSKEEVDFIVCHIETVAGELHWYVIPVTAIEHVRIRLNPYTTRKMTTCGRYEKYRDAWHLIDRKYGLKRKT